VSFDLSFFRWNDDATISNAAGARRERIGLRAYDAAGCWEPRSDALIFQRLEARLPNIFDDGDVIGIGNAWR